MVTVKRGCIKRAKERAGKKEKRVRTVMTLDHVRLLIRKLYKKPARKVAPADRRFLVQQLLLFFGMRRYDDLKEITVGDISVLEHGDLEFYVGRSKTDQDGNGFVFHVSGEKYNGFSIPGVLEWYLESLDLKEKDYLFLRLRNAGRGRVVAQGSRFVGYSTAALQLKQFCLRNAIPVLTMHSGRRGGVTLAVECGLDKMTIQHVGQWSSDAVDGYFHPVRAGVGFTERALRRL